MQDKFNSMDNSVTSLLQEALHQAPDSVLWVDRQGSVVYANQEALTSFSLDKSRLGENPVDCLIPEFDHIRLEQVWQEVREDNLKSLECRYNADGSQLLPAEVRLKLHGNGNTEYLGLYLRSIVERNEAERLLRLVAKTISRSTGEDFFRTLVRSLAEALNIRVAFVTECVDNPTTTVRRLAHWRDGGFVENTEFALEGTPCKIVINEARVCYYPARLEQLFVEERGRGVESYLGVPIYNAAETRVIGHIALMDSKEIPENFYIKAAFDIFCSRASAEMERTQVIRTLKKQEEKYRLLVENQHELVSQLNADGKFEFVSPSLCQLFSKSEQELLGQKFVSLAEPTDREVAQSVLNRLSKPQHRLEFEHRAKTASGWRWLAWSLKANLDKKNSINSIVSVGRDVTNRRAAEDNARVTLQELAHLSRLNSMGEMASAFAHEVNQPLCAILSFSQACQRMIQSEQINMEDLYHAVERIAANAEQAGTIIKQMRGYIRKDNIEHQPVDVNTLIQDTLILSHAETKHTDTSVEVKCDPGLPAVNINPTQIQQVILNLLRNAVDSIMMTDSPGEIFVHARRQGATKVLVSVHDNGPGISAGLREQVFDPFVTSKKDGIGIGLSICKSIIESHGGNIEVESESESGTCFRFNLPVTENLEPPP